MAFRSVLPAASKKPRSQANWPDKNARGLYMLRENFTISTWLLFGALIQSSIVFVVPRVYALLPVVLLLLVRFADSLAIAFGLKRNHYLNEAVLHRVSPQIPDADGNFHSASSQEKVVVFMLGAKLNHPHGIFAPNVRRVGEDLGRMIKDLERNTTDNGFLGGSSWTSQDKNGATETLFLSYWRSTEAIHNFAYKPVHRDVWEWWNATADENRHIGINHEIFEVDRHHWEAVYINFQPTLLGATTYLRKGDKMIGGTVDDQWLSPLIDARRGPLRSSAGRLGRDPQQNAEKYHFDGYGAE